jgi:hypothetical protein
MERGRSARTTHVARVTSLPHEPSHLIIRMVEDDDVVHIKEEDDPVVHPKAWEALNRV